MELADLKRPDALTPQESADLALADQGGGYGVSRMESLGASIEQSFALNTTPLLAAYAGHLFAGGEEIQPDELNKMYAGMGVTFDRPMSVTQADDVVDRKARMAHLDRVLQEGPNDMLQGGLSLAAGFATTMVDPTDILIGLTTAGVGAVAMKGAKFSRLTRTILAAENMVGKTGVRLGAGVLAAGTEQVLAEPARFEAAQELMYDYDAADSVSNIVYGALFGGLITAGSGKIGDWFGAEDFASRIENRFNEYKAAKAKRKDMQAERRREAEIETEQSRAQLFKELEGLYGEALDTNYVSVDHKKLILQYAVARTEAGMPANIDTLINMDPKRAQLELRKELTQKAKPGQELMDKIADSTGPEIAKREVQRAEALTAIEQARPVFVRELLELEGKPEWAVGKDHKARVKSLSKAIGRLESLDKLGRLTEAEQARLRELNSRNAWSLTSVDLAEKLELEYRDKLGMPHKWTDAEVLDAYRAGLPVEEIPGIDLTNHPKAVAAWEATVKERLKLNTEKHIAEERKVLGEIDEIAAAIRKHGDESSAKVQTAPTRVETVEQAKEVQKQTDEMELGLDEKYRMLDTEAPQRKRFEELRRKAQVKEKTIRGLVDCMLSPPKA